MAKLKYISDDTEFNREASSIEFQIPEDLDIYEFHRICIRLASSMGYHPDSIGRAFGVEYDSERIIEDLMDELDMDVNTESADNAYYSSASDVFFKKTW